MIKMKKLVESGVIGEVFRVQLICSSWFRTQAYCDSGAWRGTWDGGTMKKRRDGKETVCRLEEEPASLSA